MMPGRRAVLAGVTASLAAGGLRAAEPLPAVRLGVLQFGTVQWVSDTWVQGASTVAAMHKVSADLWYFITVDYALGQALEGDATTALVAAGGKVLGRSRLPLGTTDFGSP